MITTTLAETYQAGWDAAAELAPLTPEEVTRLAALWGPHLRAQMEEAA